MILIRHNLSRLALPSGFETRFFSRRRRVAALALILAVLGGTPAAVQATTLPQAVLVASERDPGITAMRQQVARRSVDIEAARDQRYPQFSISADTNTTDANGAGVTLTVSQVLYDWGRVRNLIASTSQERVKSVSELKMGIEQLTLEVSNFYLDIEVLDRKIARTRDYLGFAQRIAEHAAARAQGGLGDSGEVARAELEIARTEERLDQLTSERGLALSQLAFLMGRAPGSIAKPPELGFAGRYAKADAVEAAVRLSPDFIAANAELGVAEAGIALARAERLPVIRLQAQGRADLDGGRSRTAVGLAAGVDLNAGSFSGRQIQSAQLEADAARSNMEAIRRNLANGAQSAVERVRVLRASEASQSRQLAQAQQVLDSYEEQFVGGQRELIDLLTTGRDLYDAQIDSIATYDARKRTEYQAAHDLGVLGTLILANSAGG
ncbi:MULTISPECIES: TolC family protein [Paracoccus]|uniref:Adhesin transport system outer membrane protein n=1 Tax=Paracoccus versutus TaxID=34007 RepID=A0A3D9XGG9_PARVE|nr:MULTISPECIES: TolC family protein [Paracoccus]REF69534.1 adhesin transport system outer membrane protein [Paracoccus versutus]